MNLTDIFITIETKTFYPDNGRVSVCLENIKACGDEYTASDIEFFMFLPNGTGYICQAKGSLYWKEIPKTLEQDIKTKGVTCVAMGKGDSWFTVHRDGTVGSQGVSDSVVKSLSTNMKQYGGIKVDIHFPPYWVYLLTFLPVAVRQAFALFERTLFRRIHGWHD